MKRAASPSGHQDDMQQPSTLMKKQMTLHATSSSKRSSPRILVEIADKILLALGELPLVIATLIEAYAQSHVYVYRPTPTHKKIRTDDKEVGYLEFYQPEGSPHSLLRFVTIRRLYNMPTAVQHLVIGDWFYFLIEGFDRGIVFRIPLYSQSSDTVYDCRAKERMPIVFWEYAALNVRAKEVGDTFPLMSYRCTTLLRVYEGGGEEEEANSGECTPWIATSVAVSLSTEVVILYRLKYAPRKRIQCTGGEEGREEDKSYAKRSTTNLPLPPPLQKLEWEWISTIRIKRPNYSGRKHPPVRFSMLSATSLLFYLEEPGSTIYFLTCNLRDLLSSARKKALPPAQQTQSPSLMPFETIVLERKPKGNGQFYCRVQKCTLASPPWRLFEHSTKDEFCFAAEPSRDTLLLAHYGRRSLTMSSRRALFQKEGKEEEEEAIVTSGYSPVCSEHSLMWAYSGVKWQHSAFMDLPSGMVYFARDKTVMHTSIPSLFSDGSLFQSPHLEGCSFV